MSIHHSQLKKAERIGLILTEEDNLVRAFYPSRNVSAFGVSAIEALAQGEAMMKIVQTEDRFRFDYDEGNKRLVTVRFEGEGNFDYIYAGQPATFTSLLHDGTKLFDVGNKDMWVKESRVSEAAVAQNVTMSEALHTIADVKVEVVERSENGIPLNGTIAYIEGVSAADCPYSSDGDEEEYANFERWNNEWDDKADEASEEEQGKSGSVVKPRYRAKYAEMGHPAHCGDWLAGVLNNICLSADTKQFMLGPFEEICSLNGISLDKYDRTHQGWLGRLRMTGRNLLARRVYLNEGKLTTIGGEVLTAPEEWMVTRNFAKVKPVKSDVTPS